MTDLGEVLGNGEVELMFSDQGFAVDVRWGQVSGGVGVGEGEREEIVVSPGWANDEWLVCQGEERGIDHWRVGVESSGKGPGDNERFGRVETRALLMSDWV